MVDESEESISVTKGDVTKWALEKGAVETTHELEELVKELSAALQEAVSSALRKHPECASFFGVRGRVEIATSTQNETLDIRGYMGFGIGCNREYVEELERWSREELAKRKKDCESGSNIHSPSESSLKELKILMELKKAIDKLVEDDNKEDEA